MEPLERQLEHLGRDSRSPGIKKVPPAVPPKKNKAQPQVPHSSATKQTCEPYFATEINSCSYGMPLYSNLPQNGNTMNKRAPYIEPTTETYNSYGSRKETFTPIGKMYSEPIYEKFHGNPYSNVPYFSNDGDVGLPLPPPELVEPHLGYNIQDRPLPSTSPVSSNYSELARVANQMQNYQPDYTYGGSQISSTYESLYEPINPRPQSSMSNNSATYVNYPINRKNAQNALSKEAEVDALTDILVKSINECQDPDVYGVCIKCHQKVVGEDSGCTAMNQVYHVKCFLCYICNANLQGKPFFAVDGHPYCEIDYIETLEKCSVCAKPIMDRILRATGKPYHPLCFTCVVCGKSLDGIPFTVDAANEIHCIEDFHKKFAPRCCVCKLPIMPEPGEEETVRVVALDRSFHVTCYRCEDCGLLLTSGKDDRGCYPLDNHILCKNCNAQRIRKLTTVMTTDL